MLEHDLAYQRNLLADEEYKMRPAKNVMLTVSIIHILFAALAFFSGPKMKEELIGTVILFFIGLIFFIFSFLILNHPRSVSIAGLVLYCLLLAFYALVAYFKRMVPHYTFNYFGACGFMVPDKIFEACK